MTGYVRLEEAEAIRERGTRRPLDVIDPTTWQDQPIPPRRWLVDGLIPVGAVCMLGGDGGLGKSLLAMQLLTACATGKQWLGRPTLECPAFGVFCEDPADELQRRQADICRHHDIAFSDLASLALLSRVGQENALCYFAGDTGRCEPTNLLGDILNQALGFEARLVVLDSLHDLFTGNENNRVQARAFVGLLRQIALEIDGAVVLTAHPSLAGRNSGTGESGSTAWGAAVRSRLYLRKPDGAERDERVLASMKANYSASGDEVRLKWREGVFVPEEAEGGMVAVLNRKRAEAAFLACLDASNREGRDVSASPQASNYAPKVFARRKERDGRKVADFEAAMEELFSAGRIKVEEVGRTGDRRRRIARTDPRAQGELDA